MEWEHNDPYAFSRDERNAIEEIAEKSVAEVRRLLPDVPRPIILRVNSSPNVNPETGESGENAQPNFLVWEVDPHHPGGVPAVIREQLRPMLFHELHHLVRATRFVDVKLKEHVIREGLATAFERDAAGASPPWAASSPEIVSWSREVLALPDDTPRDPWLAQHPDGRRWIGLRVGTYLVDRAMKASGKTAADLVFTATDRVLELAASP